MTLVANRRTILALGAATLAAGTRPVFALVTIRGTITYEGGDRIPEGGITLLADDAAHGGGGSRSHRETRLQSDGAARAIGFDVQVRPQAMDAPPRRLVALLERSDGWLIARGSVRLADDDRDVRVVLSEVMY